LKCDLYRGTALGKKRNLKTLQVLDENWRTLLAVAVSQLFVLAVRECQLWLTVCCVTRVTLFSQRLEPRGRRAGYYNNKCLFCPLCTFHTRLFCCFFLNTVLAKLTLGSLGIRPRHKLVRRYLLSLQYRTKARQLIQRATIGDKMIRYVLLCLQ
jgi:hypothetical protein